MKAHSITKYLFALLAAFALCATARATAPQSPPTVANPIPSQKAFVNVAYSFAFAVNTFADADPGTVLTYAATKTDGSPLPGWLSFNPATRTFSGTPAAADIAVESLRVTATDDGAPTLSVSADFSLAISQSVIIGAASVVEGNSGDITLNLPVTRSVTDTEFTVNYAVTGGTATNGADFTLAAGTLTFTVGGGASQNIAITVHGDTVLESSETVTVTLSGLVNITGTTGIRTASASGTITNDDTIPLVYPPTNAVTGTVKGSILLGGAEIPAFDPVSKRAFASSSLGIQVVDLTDPAAPVQLATIEPATLGVAGLTSNDVSSIAVRKGAGANPSILAAAIITSPKSDPGFVVFVNAADGTLLGSAQVGANPDNLSFTPDGTKVLVANEAEIVGNLLVAPAALVAADTTLGTVSIIDVSGGFTTPPVANANFTAYDGQVAALRAAGVRIFDGGTPSTDFEPEYIAISADGTQAMVTIQEANAVATLDIASATFTSVVALGKKNFSTLRADFSDRDGPASAQLLNPATGNPVLGLYMPDAIASYTAGGQTYYVTANEGDDRNDFFSPIESTTVGNAAYVLDPTAFPNAAALKAVGSLGRLTVSNSPGLRGDTDNDGDVDEILAYGGRSFSILDAAGNLVFDSGDMIELIVASQHLANFDDARSDNKGPEPEGVTIAKLGSRTYAFVGLERSHMVLVFDVTNPGAVTYTTAFKRAGDLNPEGLIVVRASDSPSGKALLITTSEVSNTLSVFELEFNEVPVVSNTIPNRKAFVDGALSFAFAANTFSDPIGGTLTYAATQADGSPLPGWLSFNPATRTFSGTPAFGDSGTLSVKVTATDDGLPPESVSTTFSITVGRPVSIAAASIAEGNSGSVTLSLPVTRGGSDTAFTVNYAVTGGTATSGTDFTLASGTLTFDVGGAAAQNIAITVNGDVGIESNETITVTLSSLVDVTGVTMLNAASASGTITNDDTIPVAFPATNALTPSVLGSISLTGAEIPAFDPVSVRAFASSSVGIQVVDLANPAAPTLITTIEPATLAVAGLTSNDVTSVVIRKGSPGNPSILAAAILASPKTDLGHVIFLNAADGTLLGSALVGANPDNITFTPDGTKLLVANEGELDGTAVDVAAETTLGTVSIIDVSGGFAAPPVTTADFTAFDSQVAALKSAGVRIFNNGTSDALPSVDFEPEYIAVSPDGTKAMVTLQEANAVATLDIASATFTSVVALGKKDFSTLRADFSDRDGPANAQLLNPTTGNPVFGLYMPDSIASYSAGGQTYYVTANEGDDRNDFLTPDESTSVGNSGYVLDPTIFPNAAALKAVGSLGRLTVSNAPGLRGDTDGDGDIDEILAYGGRSFSILDAAGNLVFDSGDMIELIVMSQHLSNFDDGRSDNKGPEPEGVTIAKLGSRTYAFVGLERSHMVLMFDVTNPTAVSYTTAFKRAGDLNPEGMAVVPAGDSPTGNPLLITANESSNTLSVFEIGTPQSAFTLQVLHYYGESGLLGIETAPILGAMIDRFNDEYASTVVLGEGDSFIPGPWLVAGADPALSGISSIGSTALGRPDIAIMNAFGTTASALGNHEFDLGSPVLADALFPAGAWAGAQFPLITANLNFSGDSSLRGRTDPSLGGTGGATAGMEVSSIKAKIAPYAVRTLNGEKIGFVGATTWELLSKSSPNGTVPKDDGNPATSDLQEVAAYLQAAVDALHAAGVNKIVMVDQLDTLQRNKDLAGMVAGIDIMVAGGGHERMGDETDVAVPFNGHDANFVGDTYPIVTASLDGKPVLIVTTDTEYSYLGRLVVDFTAGGEVIVPTLDTAINGAYAASEATLQAAYATSDSAATIIAGSAIGSSVKTITDAINNVVVTKDSNVFGYTNVYLEGDRVFGRTQEVNLGNITADANALAARIALGLGDGDAVFSLKNGGGIRASVGSVLADGTKVGPLANPITGKPTNAISQLDVENALRFNNKLMVCDMTPTGLIGVLNFAAGLSSGPAVQAGGYPQVGNIRFSYDSSLPAGQKVRTAVMINEAGEIVARIVENGVIRPDAPALIQAVVLNFTMNGGDSYPFKYLNPPTNTVPNNECSNFRYVLTNGTLSGQVDRSLNFTSSTTFSSLNLTAADILGEQDAFESFLGSRHATPATAFNLSDTPVAQDKRIQQLAQNGNIDTVNVGSDPQVFDGPDTASPAIADGQVAPVDFGPATIDESVSKTFTIRNDGADDLSGFSITFDGPNSDDFIVASAPGEPVAEGATTTFSVTFTPSRAGARSASMHIASNAIGREASYDVALTGTGEYATLTGGAVNDAATSTAGITTIHPLANDTGTVPFGFISSVSDPRITISADGRQLTAEPGYSDTFTYTVNGQVTGTITITAAPPLANASRFAGQILDAEEQHAGAIRATRSSSGIYSASILLGESLDRVKFRLNDAPGGATATVDSDLGSVTITESTATGELLVTIGNSHTATLRACVSTAAAARYNIALAALDADLRGGGYARARVKTNGVINIVAKLPDGRNVSGSSYLADNGTFVFHNRVSFTNPAASVGGEFVLANLTVTDITGELRWTSPTQTRGLDPHEHDTIITANGCLYEAGVSPLPAGPVNVEISGGDLPADVLLTSTATGGVVAATGELVLLRPKTEDGVAQSGTFKAYVVRGPGGRTVNSIGVYLPKSGSAWGYFPGTTTGGRIVVTAP